MHKRGISRFSVINFLAYSTEKFRRGTLLCFRNFLVSKNVMDKKGGGREGGSVTIRNRRNIWHDRDSNQGLTASKPFCPDPTAVIYF